MNSFITWICIINEFVWNKKGTDDFGHTSNILKIAENNVILNMPQKPKTKLLFETPDTLQSLRWFKDTDLFLSPATQKFHDSIENATKLSEVVYNTWKLKEVQKNIIDSINHILNHNLVCEHPAAANFVAVVERNMHKIKEEFNKVVLSTFGSNFDKDN
jgi:hypothetical protein